MVFNPRDPVARAGRGVVMVARFAGPLEAATARSTLEATLDELASEVDELFELSGGVVEVEQVQRIYARSGLRNEVGWHQDRPIRVKGAELIWELPEGADIEDAENLLVSIGALSVVAHRAAGVGEEWRMAPHPFPIELPVDDDDPERSDQDQDDGYPTLVIPKRTLH
jgi:hypothetical protein